jgi:hypothetical protein
MEKTLVVTFVVPITIKANDDTDRKEIARAVLEAAKKRISEGTYTPISVEELNEVVPKDETGSNQIPGHKDGRPEIDNNMGSSERQNTDINKNVQRPKSRKEKRDNAGTTGETRNAIQDNAEKERGISSHTPNS